MNQLDYYSPGEIRFTKQQVLWLIPLLPLLRSGFYPPNPTDSGYTDAPMSQRPRKQRASFVIPCEIAAELDSRLEQAGLDGLLLELVYSQDTGDFLGMMQHIAGALKLEVRTIDKRIHQALRFISGYRRKERSYQEFRQHKRGNRR